MREGLRISLIVAILCGLAILTLVLFKAGADRRRKLTCAGIKVEFADSYRFLAEKDIEEYLSKDYGPLIGKLADSVDLAEIERILAGKSAVLKADAYMTPDGFLNVRIHQREPVVRFQKGKFGFYADERGFLFPLQKNYTSRVPIIDGQVPIDIPAGYKGEARTEQEKAWLSSVLELIGYMGKTSPWKDMFSQISVNGEGDIVMIPADGDERFIFGRPEDYERKFARIKKYYTAILPAKGKGHYATVNVKYDGQIVCRE